MSSPIRSREIGDVGGADHGGRIVRQHQVLPLVVAVDDRLDPGAAHLGRGVDVGDEADHRHVRLFRRRRNGRHHVAMLVDGGVGEADRLQLVDEMAQEVELLGRAGIGLRVLVRLGVEGHVAQEPLDGGGLESRIGHGRMVSEAGARAKGLRRPFGASPSTRCAGGAGSSFPQPRLLHHRCQPRRPHLLIQPVETPLCGAPPTSRARRPAASCRDRRPRAEALWGRCRSASRDRSRAG